MSKDSSVTWIWENPNWADFKYNLSKLNDIILLFDFNNQITLRNSILFENSEDDEFVVEIQGIEAIKTSEIEGETYQLPEIIGSIRSGFNILANTDHEKNSQSLQERRKSVSAMMVDLYKHFKESLKEDTLHYWNILLTEKHDGQNKHSGKYRTYTDEMMVGNGTPGSEPDFIAPKSVVVEEEMKRFVEWFNATGASNMHPLIRAGLAHLYFVTIHPYDDGNGRIARALSIKAISEANKEPTLISLSHAISEDKAAYYKALQQAQKDHNVDAWLEYFCKTAVRAQDITKAKLYQTAVKRTILNKHESSLNSDQIRAIESIISGEGIKSEGVISIKEYVNVNIDSMRQRAKDADKPFKEIAADDIEGLLKLKIITKSKRKDCEKFVMLYPTTHGISAYKTRVGNTRQADIKPKDMKAANRP